MKTQRRRGFTVVELVVVIAIIAVLAAVLIPTFTSIVKKANDSAYLQERTNQQIADLAEKVEKINYFTWEDFEKKLAEELAKVGSTDTEAIQKAVDAAIAKYSDSSQTGNTGLTETQVKKIVEEAMKGQLTTAQVEAIVRQVLSGTTVSEETIRTIVNNAVKGMSTTGVTKAQVEQAIKAAISGTIAVNDEQLEAAVTNALKAFGVSTITDQKVEEIVNNLKNVITINEEAGFSTGSYAINPDDANKVFYLVTDAVLDSFTITGSTEATTIIIDAPNIKKVTIENNAKVLRVLRTADESTHIKGTVTTLEVNSGRVVIEDGATVTDVKAAPAKQATVTIVLKNGSEVTNLNSEFQYYAGTNDYIKIIDEGATIENSFITSSSAVTTSTTTNVELSGSAFVDTTTETATLKVKNESGVSADIKVNDTTYTSDGETSDLMLFAGGTGTEADPFLIVDYNTFQNISKLYDNGYNYFKVKDGIATINLNNCKYVSLNGSFDGNNVVFTHVNGGMFGNVGTYDSNDTKTVVLKNFTVQNEGGWGIVQECGATTLEFNNISVTGYSLHNWNAGEFLRYGSGEGFDYTVNFIKCSCNAEIYSTQNSWSTILVGHTYPGGSAVATINVDAYTDEHINDSTLYYTGIGTPEGHKYYGMGGVKVYVNGMEKNATDNKAVTNIVKVDSTKNPAKSESGYSITTQADTTKAVVTLLWQYTEWEDNYSAKIPDLSGVGGTIGKTLTFEVTGSTEVDVFDAITSVEIRTNSDKWDYELKDGKLILYMTNTNTYIDGTLTLFVEQYTAGSNIAKYKGSLTLATKTTSSEWVIK